MTKKELETKVKELELKIIALEARPQIFCAGHYCNCHHTNFPNPTYPNYPPYSPTWISTSPNITGGLISGGNSELLKSAN